MCIQVSCDYVHMCNLLLSIVGFHVVIHIMYHSVHCLNCDMWQRCLTSCVVWGSNCCVYLSLGKSVKPVIHLSIFYTNSCFTRSLFSLSFNHAVGLAYSIAYRAAMHVLYGISGPNVVLLWPHMYVVSFVYHLPHIAY